MTEGQFRRERLSAESIRGVRYYHTPSGGFYPSVTSILGVQEKKALSSWKVKNVAELAVNKLNDWTTVQDNSGNLQVVTRLGDQAAIDWLKKATDYNTDARDAGEIVHKIWEDLALGREPFVPIGFEFAVEQWKRFNEDFEVEVFAVEPEVWNDTYMYAGSLDACYRIRARGWWVPETDDTSGVDWNQWQTVVADVKSGNGLYGSTAYQCMMYAKAEKMIHPDKGVIDMPEITATAGIWVRPSGYAFYPLDMSDDTWKHIVAARRMFVQHNNDWSLRGKAINPNAIKSAGPAPVVPR